MARCSKWKLETLHSVGLDFGFTLGPGGRLHDLTKPSGFGIPQLMFLGC